MSDPSIEMVPLGEIKPYEANPRSRPTGQRRALMASIRKNGFNAPIVIDEHSVILNGHGRYEAALELELNAVPTVRVTHLTDAEKRAYRVADNKIQEMSAWDMELLSGELRAVIEAGVKYENLGFSAAEIDLVLDRDAEAKGPDIAPEDELPAPSARVHTRSGQTWTLGKHRISCGDARSMDDVARLMAGESATAAFTDPPYNVKIEGFAGGSGAVKHKDFAMAVGEMSPPAYTDFLARSLTNTAQACTDGAIIFACIDWRHLPEMSAAGKEACLQLLNLIVWVKSNGGMGTFYRSRHELIFAFKRGDAPHINNFGLGEGGRYRTNVWEYRGANAFGPTRQEDLAAHPTVKPARMVADALKDVSRRGDIVVDLFGGSGSTLIAAEMTGRRARLLEIAPEYVDLTVRRWQKATGQFATDSETGVRFDDVDVDP